ncbi:MAG: putative N-acetylmannosamine-6-phosphate 2-epimerase [Firmicutes bacterium]|nr:putative N-acetylmannosamine-6-phosphate 2-epimerase [Bacillota bacterium]
MAEVLKEIKNGVVVSCQALEDEPLHGPILMAAMARAAAQGGALGIRTNGVQEVEVIKKITGLPVIGLRKAADPKGRICITPYLNQARALVRAGADLIAVDGRRQRPFGEDLDQLIPRIRKELGVPVIADCGSFADGEAALEIGVDALATTFGFKEGIWGSEPGFDLLEALVPLGFPVLAEGGFWQPEQILQALRLGAWSVVVGTAVTRPREITRRLVRACRGRRPESKGGGG